MAITSVVTGVTVCTADPFGVVPLYSAFGVVAAIPGELASARAER